MIILVLGLVWISSLDLSAMGSIRKRQGKGQGKGQRKGQGDRQGKGQEKGQGKRQVKGQGR